MRFADRVVVVFRCTGRRLLEPDLCFYASVTTYRDSTAAFACAAATTTTTGNTGITTHTTTTTTTTTTTCQDDDVSLPLPRLCHNHTQRHISFHYNCCFPVSPFNTYPRYLQDTLPPPTLLPPVDLFFASPTKFSFVGLGLDWI